MTIEDKFVIEAAKPTDMVGHMETLKTYAAQCESVVEFGVYDCTSTWGLLAGRPKRMRSYDVARRPEVDEVVQTTANSGVDFKFFLASSVEVTIEETDLLFIDSLHTYGQLKSELTLHARKAKKFIIMHDTTLFADHDENGSTPGLWKAVDEFLTSNCNWHIKERFTNCHGLTILERHPA